MNYSTNSTINYGNITDCHVIAELSGNITLQCELIHLLTDCIEDSLIDYANIAFCMIQSKFLTLLLFGTVLSVLFLAISITADDFLCPLLVSISSSLNLSDNVAGVTFLALGNGAPDIFSSISGISKNDISLVIGQLYGGGIFVTTIVIGSILIREQFPIMHRPLLRDVLFYLITTSLVFITFRSGILTLSHSLAFIMIYLIYVLVVILSGIIYRRNERQKVLNNIAQEQTMPGESVLSRRYEINTKLSSKLSLKELYVPGPGDDFEGVTLRRIKFRKYPHDTSSHNNNNHQQRRLTLYHIGCDDESTRINKESICENIDLSNKNSILSTTLHYPRRLTISDTEFPNQMLSNNIEKIRRTPLSFERDSIINKKSKKTLQNKENNKNKDKNNKIINEFHKNSQVLKRNFCFSIQKLFHIEHENDDLTNGNCYGIEWKSFFFQITQLDQWKQSRSIIAKFIILVKAPIYLLFNLTIPIVDKELKNSGWNRLLILMNVLFGPQCLLLLTKFELNIITGIELHSIALGISLFALVMIILTSKPEIVPPYHIVFAYIGFTISVAWIYTIANEVVSLLKAVGIVFKISQFLLGLTFLAWGNSLGDLISNLSMAKNGFPRMAISACLGGPVLNMLLGMGIPYSVVLLKDISTKSFIQIQASNQSTMVTIMFTTITISLLFTVIMFIFFTDFKSTKTHGFILYSIYISFILASLYTEYIFK